MIINSVRLICGVLASLVRIFSFGKFPFPIPVASVLVTRKGKVLGIKRADNSKIGLPGGIIHWKETPEQAAVRETYEETGLEVEIIKLVGVYPCFEGTFGLNSIHIAYSAKVIGGKLKGSYEGQPGWYNAKDCEEIILFNLNR